MNYPTFDKNISDKKLIKEFYINLLQKYPVLNQEVENEGLLHVDMVALRRYAERLCRKRKVKEFEELAIWLNGFFCRSKNELYNAIMVSFLEYFNYEKLSTDKFKEIMPEELYQGYKEIMDYMRKMSNEITKIKNVQRQR